MITKGRTHKQVRIIIERSNDSYSSYAEIVPGIYGQGDTVEEAKQSALKGIDLLKKYNKDENVPAVLKGNMKQFIHSILRAVNINFDKYCFRAHYRPLSSL